MKPGNRRKLGANSRGSEPEDEAGMDLMCSARRTGGLFCSIFTEKEIYS